MESVMPMTLAPLLRQYSAPWAVEVEYLGKLNATRTSLSSRLMICRSKGAKVVGITDSISSPLGRNCDHVLLAKSDMISLVDSLTAPLSIVNALIVAIASRREKELEKKFSELETVWEKYNVYEKQVDL